MRKLDFVRLPEIEKEKDMDKFEVGERFLYGSNTIAQKTNKEVGQSITYYEVLRKTHNGIEYIPIFDYMEEDKGEEI
jgi:hypothetical protein